MGLVLQIAFGIVAAALLLWLLMHFVEANANARAEATIRRHAEQMNRDGYVWFMGDWVKRHGDLPNPVTAAHHAVAGDLVEEPHKPMAQNSVTLEQGVHVAVALVLFGAAVVAPPDHQIGQGQQ